MQLDYYRKCAEIIEFCLRPIGVQRSYLAAGPIPAVSMTPPQSHADIILNAT